MWDHVKVLPFGRLSIRNIFMFAAAMFVASFIYTVASAPTAYAADADWNGNSIMYQQKEYVKIENAKAGDSRGFAEGTQVYAYIEPTTSGPNTPTSKAHLIYFAPGVDPPKATSASYAVYNHTPPDVFKGPATGQATITLTPQATASAGTTSCDSTFTFGIGWIICPVVNFLASAMDHLFDILAGFLTVRPAQTNQENALYRAWSVMRNFANVSFVIAFLIIIYSQITSIGLSNYDIKKMLPRLIVAAVLVNISYWICAVAIDISNILGWSIQEVFIAIRNNLVGAEGNSWDALNFKSIAGFILSGGTAAAAGGVGIASAIIAGGGIGGALYMLLPILVGVIIAVLVALLIMAARQAIITLLVIVSPLAFVAYLLPNTEKYFTKWRELGMTMLLLFPIFSVVFGGSQLAGMAIIQNADSINLILLGMGVQVAPVIITPLLVKFSGSLLARIGGMVNNPGKGLIDRTRKFAEERRDQRKARLFTQPLNRRRDAVARMSRNFDNRRRDREGNQKADEALADANWTKTRAYSDIQQKAFDANAIKTSGEADAENRYELAKRTNAATQNLEFTARASKVKLDLTKANVEADWEEVMSGSSDRLITPSGLAGDALRNYRAHNDAFAQDMQHDAVQSEVAKSRKHFAEHEQQQHYAQAMQDSTALQMAAGGVAGQHGADSALAAAIANKRKAYGQAVAEAHEILKHLNLSREQRQDLVMGNDVVITNPTTGEVLKTFNAGSVHAREAAIEAQLRGEGKYTDIQDIIAASGGALHEFRTTIGSEVASNRLHEKAAFLGGQTINDIKQGKIKTMGDLDVAVARTIATGKIQPSHLADMDVDAVRHVLRVAKTGNTSGLSPADASALAAQIATLGKSAHEALTNTSLKGRVAQNVEPLLEDIRRTWPPPTPPSTP